jgi:hypothetical protein
MSSEDQKLRVSSTSSGPTESLRLVVDPSKKVSSCPAQSGPQDDVGDLFADNGFPSDAFSNRAFPSDAFSEITDTVQGAVYTTEVRTGPSIVDNDGFITTEQTTS